MPTPGQDPQEPTYVDAVHTETRSGRPKTPEEQQDELARLLQEIEQDKRALDAKKLRYAELQREYKSHTVNPKTLEEQKFNRWEH